MFPTPNMRSGCFRDMRPALSVSSWRKSSFFAYAETLAALSSARMRACSSLLLRLHLSEVAFSSLLACAIRALSAAACCPFPSSPLIAANSCRMAASLSAISAL